MNVSDESLSPSNGLPPADLPGQKLADARRQQGLSVEQVAAETKLSVRYVQALEANDYAALPGTTFVRGYIRRYADMLGIASDVLVAAFDRQAGGAVSPLGSTVLAGLILASPLAQAQPRNPGRIVVEAPHLGAGMLANRLRAGLPRAIAAFSRYETSVTIGLMRSARGDGTHSLSLARAVTSVHAIAPRRKR